MNDAFLGVNVLAIECIFCRWHEQATMKTWKMRLEGRQKGEASP